MLKDVIINVHSIHDYDKDNSDTIEFTTDGLFTTEDGVRCITYNESDVTGMAGTRTSVFVMEDKVVVDRDGSITSRMEFEEGGKSSFLYRTPFGNATLGVKTRKIRQNLTDDGGGKLEIDYVLDMDHAVASKNRLSLEIRNA